MKVQRVCSWCGKHMGWAEFSHDWPEGTVTHGICPECIEREFHRDAPPVPTDSAYNAMVSQCWAQTGG